MPYLITTSLYPSDKVPAVVERYLEVLTKYPPDESLGEEVVPVAVKSTHQGIKSISITDIKEGKLDAAYNRTVNEMVMFQSIEGFEYTIEAYSKVEEAMAAVGADMP